ncbi:MAG TPA: hypothetical protein VGF32_33055 [Streptosporangiaceae bacterium]
MAGDLGASRLALALLRLAENGDQAAVDVLLAELTADELRAVLTVQTRNVGLVFEAVFAEVYESRLPGLAAEHGRTRGEVTADYLERLILRLALREAGQP